MISQTPRAKKRMGFTLIELLVVIAIIAILAAILFPVFAQAREKARAIACISNMKQMATASLMYSQDYDEKFYPHRFNCDNTGTGKATIPCSAYFDGNGNVLPEAKMLDSNSLKRYYWCYLLQPYIKSFGVFACPSNPSAFPPTSGTPVNFNFTGVAVGNGYGGQNSYGHNDTWMSPAGNFATGGEPTSVSQASIPRVSSTVLITDASYYGSGPDLTNLSGTTNFSHCTDVTDCMSELKYMDGEGSQYRSYWKNVGNANWCATNGTLSDADAINLGKGRHNAIVNCVFADGHAKGMPWSRLVGDVCYWTTDADGPHPNCN